MGSLSTIQSFWTIISEIDLRPLAAEAQQEVLIALVGPAALGRDRLASQMRCDPARPDLETDTPILVLDLEQGLQARQAELTILLLDGSLADFSAEKALAHQLADAGKRVLVYIVQETQPAGGRTPPPVLPWKPRYLLAGPTGDLAFLRDKFAPLMIRMLPDRLLSLGRNLPFFRLPIAHHLISDAAQSNAAYSLATGLAEVVPVLNIPLVFTDTILLTKNQAFLAYKLGLAFGFSTEWKNYLAEFSGVLGFGFLFRQLARMLVGLIPGFGIIPKVAVSYAGTTVVGNSILQWYLTGRHVSGSQLKSAYQQAYLKGKQVAARLRPRRKAKALPAGTAKEPALKPGKTKARPKRNQQICSGCGQVSAKGARFCQYCGKALESSPAKQS